MNGNNRYTIFPSSAFSTYSNIRLGPRGNKRKNFRDRVKWRQEFEKPLDSPSGLLWFIDSRA